jgi:predicted  nucleic acid-binding Zn-ribbon protein
MAQFADVDGCRRVLRTTSRQRISRALEHYIYTSQALRNHSTISLRGLTSEEACEAIKAMREDRELQQLKQDFKEATAALEATEHETERTLKDVEEYEKGLKVQMKALENVMRKLHEMK